MQGNPYGPNHIDVGIIGTTFIFDTLTKYLISLLGNISTSGKIFTKQNDLLGICR